MIDTDEKQTKNKSPIPNNKPFKKGQSGNPNGRPKGVRNRSTIVKEFFNLLSTTKNPITGKKQELTYEELMNLSMIHQAINGNVQAYKELNDNAYGKQKDSLQVESQNKTDLSIDVTNEDVKTILRKFKESNES